MSRKLARLGAAALILATPSGALPAAGATTATHERVYLLGADTDYLYWGVDPFDPELGVGTLSRDCGVALVTAIPDRSKPCLWGANPDNGNNTFTLFFLPSTLFEEKLTWSPSSPLTFHIEGTISTPGASFTVHLDMLKGSTLVSSPAATQVAPGVWEGQLTTGGPLNPRTTNLMGVRVESQASAASIELDLRGSSYLELPRPYAARSVPDLIREDSYAPQPATFASSTRSFTFNDGNWSVRSFTGETGPLRSFEFSLDESAEVVLAWVELYESSFVQDVRRGRPPDIRKLTQGAALKLTRGGEVISRSETGRGRDGHGTDAAAAQNVSAGPLTLEVDSSNETGSTLSFTAYVLEVRGERTLRSMRWRFFQQTSLRLPTSWQCPPNLEPVPATDEVRSISLDLDWDTASVGVPNWTIRFDLPDIGSIWCGELGTGDELRLTLPSEQTWYVGATPAWDALYVSAFDTTFEMQANFVYSAAPQTA